MTTAIIVLHYGDLRDTCTCLDSLSRLEGDSFQVIVVDNGTFPAAADEIAKKYPHTHVIRREVNGGWAGGNNTGIRYALDHGAKYVVLLNNDTTVSPNLLNLLLQASGEMPEYGVLGPLISFMDEPDQIRTDGFTFNLDDRFEDGPLLVIPAGKDGKAQKIAELLEKVGIQAKVKGDIVLAGKAKILDAAMQRKAAVVPALAKALAAVEGLPTRVAGTIPSAFRKSLEELSPTLPKELGGGSIAPVSRGLSWGAVGADLSAEKLQLRAIVQAKDATDAADLGRLAEKAIAILREQAEKETPEFAKGLQALQPEVKESQLRITLDARAVDGVVMPAIAKFREAAVRTESMNNLKQIGVAMHMYYDVYKTLPAQASYDKTKRPLLSWRVHLLPYLDQAALYKQFNLDEPWDSPNNKALLDFMPAVYRTGREAGVGTRFMVFLFCLVILIVCITFLLGFGFVFFVG